MGILWFMEEEVIRLCVMDTLMVTYFVLNGGMLIMIQVNVRLTI